MKNRARIAALAALAALGLAAGCEALGRQHRRSPSEIIAAESRPDGVDPSVADPSAKWSPGAWSREARDVEKSVMRTKADPTWQP